MTLSHMHILGEQQTDLSGDQTSIAASWKLVQVRLISFICNIYSYFHTLSCSLDLFEKDFEQHH